jgi:hypothetical protein
MPPFAATISKLANVILMNERLKMVINVIWCRVQPLSKHSFESIRCLLLNLAEADGQLLSRFGKNLIGFRIIPMTIARANEVIE